MLKGNEPNIMSQKSKIQGLFMPPIGYEVLAMD